MTRRLLVTADDFGIGPAVTRGILELADLGVVTSSVVLVNSPFAEAGVREWRASGRRLELGWHPCLTLDFPVSPPGRVPSLVDDSGTFLPLGRFLRRLALGGVNRTEIEAEFRAQLRRFTELVGEVPANVNAHHHIHIFEPVGSALRDVLGDVSPRPYIRRVRECRRTLARIPGARVKRFALSRFGASAALRQESAGFPGADWLAGVTDPPFVHDPEFFTRWLRHTPGDTVELTCHPGELDITLVGRDGSLEDGQLHRRVRELELLRDPAFLEAVADAGFTLVSAGALSEETLAVG